MTSSRLLALSLAALVAACSSASSDPATPADLPPSNTGDAAPPVDETPPPAPYPAFHPDNAQIDARSSRSLASPKVVVVLFAGETEGDAITSLVATIGASTYWAATTKEYGVGALSALAPIQLTETAPPVIDDADIQTFLTSHLDGSHPEFPASDGRTIYVMAYPEGTSVTRSGTASCGSAFGGYHSEVRLAPNVAAPYIVLPRCATFVGLQGRDEITFTLSHELVETAVDPFIKSAPSYNITDDAHYAWTAFFQDAEPGDLCTQYSTLPADLGFRVTRSWSNAAAKAGKQPCVPADPQPYFGAVPVVEDTYVYKSSTVPAVRIPVGTSRTIDVQVFSDGPTDDLEVAAVDSAQLRGQPPQLSLTLDKKKARNGDVLELTIKALHAGSVGSLTKLSTFAVYAKTKTAIEFRPAFVAN